MPQTPKGPPKIEPLPPELVGVPQGHGSAPPYPPPPRSPYRWWKFWRFAENDKPQD